MNNNYTAEKFSEGKRKTEAKRSLLNYTGQLKRHFDLSENDIVKILDSVVKTKKNEIIIKKWWQIWK